MKIFVEYTIFVYGKSVNDVLLALLAVTAFVGIGCALAGMILLVRQKLVSSELCTLKINGDIEKKTEGGKTLLAALTGNDIAVPSPCGGKATCKQCKVQVVSGGGDALETDKATFSPKELKEGWRLSCQCKVRGDLELTLPESLLSLREFTGRVVSNENVATFIKELVVDIPEGDMFEYRPGDYLQFHIPSYTTNTEAWKETMEERYYADWERFGLFGIEVASDEEETIRAYSMASYPGEGNRLRFTIRIATPPFVRGKLASGIPWGIASSYAFGLKEGDEIRLSGPYGESHMIDLPAPLVFLIGGAGASFGRSHILDLLLEKGSNRQISLWYGARSLKENIYQEEYEKLDAERDTFSYHLVLSEPDASDVEGGWPKDDPTKTGFLFRSFEAGELSKMEEPEEAYYYVCGPPLHNSSVMKLLDDYGVERSHIVLDDFGS